MIDYAGNAGGGPTVNQNTYLYYMNGAVDWNEGSAGPNPPGYSVANPPDGTLATMNQGNGLDGVVVRRTSPYTSQQYGAQSKTSYTPILDQTQINRSQPISLGNNGITDGASNTLMVAEKGMNLAMLGTPQIDDNFGFTAGYGPETIRWGRYQPEADWSVSGETSSSPSYIYHWAFGSSHPGVFQGVFCDGSVHTIRLSVDAYLFSLLCCRRDSQALNTDNL